MQNHAHYWKLGVKLTLSIWFCIKGIKFYVEFLKKCGFAETTFDEKKVLTNAQVNETIWLYTFVSFKKHKNS